MKAQNPDNFKLYSLASAIIKYSSEQNEITKNGNRVRVQTSEVDFELSPHRFGQVSLSLRMAPVNTLSSPEILNRLLIATLVNLAHEYGIETEDPRSKFKPKKKITD